MLRGCSINWRYLPPLSTPMLKTIARLNPKIIRYPGGTVSKSWDWQKGTSSKGGQVHPLKDLATLVKYTKAEVTFVLNIIHRSLEDQINMLKTARSLGIPIKFIEMGNEHYLKSERHRDNVIAFPTAKEYAERVNQWVPALRKEFPGAKIGVTAIGRTSRGVSDDPTDPRNRTKFWNYLLAKHLKDFDAYIYHIYARPDDSVKLNRQTIISLIKERTDDFERAMIRDSSKEIWITEYGVHTSTEQRTIALTERLADYVLKIANLSLVHTLYLPSRNSFFSLLKPPDGHELTPLGEMFAKRWRQ